MINTIEVASRSRENVTHQLFLGEQGKAIGCTCEYREHHMWTECPHMKAWNAKPAQQVYDGCGYCGRNHKSWNCPF